MRGDGRARIRMDMMTKNIIGHMVQKRDGASEKEGSVFLDYRVL